MKGSTRAVLLVTIALLGVLLPLARFWVLGATNMETANGFTCASVLALIVFFVATVFTD